MSVGGAYWICAWMGIADRRTGGRIGAQWQGLHGMQSGLGYLSFAPKKPSPHRHVYRRGDLRFYSYAAQILHGRILGAGGRTVLGQLGDKGAVQPAEAQQRNEQREYL